ncbi:hypothetical protein ACJX0J_024956 [Zea mays]
MEFMFGFVSSLGSCFLLKRWLYCNKHMHIFHGLVLCFLLKKNARTKHNDHLQESNEISTTSKLMNGLIVLYPCLYEEEEEMGERNAAINHFYKGRFWKIEPL